MAVVPIAAHGGTRTVQTPVRFTAGNANPLTTIFAGDFTADGKQDALLSESGKIRVLPGNANGTFGNAIVTSFAGGYVPEGLADFNGDTLPDL
jgi:hypothetical protein